jgi:DNA sulfur modification protein DndC
VPGPYTKPWRERWLRRVLEAQASARREGPAEFRGLTLIAAEELHEIRRIWLYDKHEFDDSLPRIFEEVTGEKFPNRGDTGNALRADDWEVLREVCGDDAAFFDLQVGLLGVERQFRGMSRRAGVFEDLKKRLERGAVRQRGGSDRGAGRAQAAGGAGGVVSAGVADGG